MSSSTSDRRPRSRCPIARSLEIIGDRWTRVVVRDLMFGNMRRYKELLDSPEGITTNILADRLRRLEGDGLVVRTAYQEHPPRFDYELSDAGKELFVVLRALIRWGGDHVPGSVVLADEQLDAMDPRSR